jgi:outer membrane biosynthesis protein TonB
VRGVKPGDLREFSNRDIEQLDRANQRTEQSETANRRTEQLDTANQNTDIINQRIEQLARRNQGTEQSETANQRTEQSETANRRTEQSETANRRTEQSETANQRTEQSETANRRTEQSETANQRTAQREETRQQQQLAYNSNGTSESDAIEKLKDTANQYENAQWERIPLSINYPSGMACPQQAPNSASITVVVDSGDRIVSGPDLAQSTGYDVLNQKALEAVRGAIPSTNQRTLYNFRVNVNKESCTPNSGGTSEG